MNSFDRVAICVSRKTRDQLFSMRKYPHLSYDQVVLKLIETSSKNNIVGEICGKKIRK